MPESKTRTSASAKAKAFRAKSASAEATSTTKIKAPKAPASRQWVPPTFITVGLLGVLWLVVYYLTASVGITIPYLTDLGGWNVMIGMGLMAASFGIATLWK